MDRIYVWIQENKKSPVHIFKDGKTLCETDSKRMNGYLEKRPKKRKLCKICHSIDQPKKKKIKPGESKHSNFYKTKEWAELRYKALKFNDGCCELCGRGKQEGVILHVDHIKPISKHPELMKKISNLQVLCASCNWGKSNKDETEWRSPRLAVLMGEEME